MLFFVLRLCLTHNFLHYNVFRCAHESTSFKLSFFFKSTLAGRLSTKRKKNHKRDRIVFVLRQNKVKNVLAWNHVCLCGCDDFDDSRVTMRAGSR